MAASPEFLKPQRPARPGRPAPPAKPIETTAAEPPRPDGVAATERAVEPGPRGDGRTGRVVAVVAGAAGLPERQDLERAGFTVRVVESSADALRLAASQPLDCWLIDQDLANGAT